MPRPGASRNLPWPPPQCLPEPAGATAIERQAAHHFIDTTHSCCLSVKVAVCFVAFCCHCCCCSQYYSSYMTYWRLLVTPPPLWQIRRIESRFLFVAAVGFWFNWTSRCCLLFLCYFLWVVFWVREGFDMLESVPNFTRMYFAKQSVVVKMRLCFGTFISVETKS